MGLFDKKSGIIDAIRCDEKSYLIWKWRPKETELGESNRENAIRWGSPIRVKDGSVAAFVYTGKNGFAQDFIEGPSDTVADTKNLPGIASLMGLVYNGSTPFQAEVYFINLAETVQVKFAVPYFDVYDPELQEYSVPVAVRGTIEFNIQDYKDFINKHRLDDFSIEDLQKQIKDTVIENVKTIVANAPENYIIRVIHLEKKITQIKYDVIELLRPKFADDYGVFLKDINISAVEIDKESEGYAELKAVTKDLTTDSLKARNKFSIKDMAADQTLGVLGKAANMFVDIKENAFVRRKQAQTEYANAVEEERAGMLGAAGAKIINAFTRYRDNVQVPPPIPELSFYVAKDGSPTGPYTLMILKRMLQDGTFGPNSFVWKEGMDNWAKANSVEELQEIFTDYTPSMPNIPEIPE